MKGSTAAYATVPAPRRHTNLGWAQKKPKQLSAPYKQLRNPTDGALKDEYKIMV